MMRVRLTVSAGYAPRIVTALLGDYGTTADALEHAVIELTTGNKQARTDLDRCRARARKLDDLLEPIEFDPDCDAIELVGERELIETALLDALDTAPADIERAIEDHRNGDGSVDDIAAVINDTRGLLALVREVKASAAPSLERSQ